MANAETAADKRKNAVRVRAGTLAKALADVTHVVGSKATVPILSYVKINVADGRMSIAATDLDIYVERELATDDRDGPDGAKWVKGIKPFVVTLPAQKLSDVVRRFDKDAMVTIEAAGDLGWEWSGQVVVKAGRARFSLNALPLCDWPAAMLVEPDAAMVIPVGVLADALHSVQHAVSTEESRYYLNGVYVHPAQATGEPMTLNFAATDGHRLARKALDLPEGGASFPPMIWPRRAVDLLAKLLGEAEKLDAPEPVMVCANDGGARMRFDIGAADGGTVMLISKAIDGTFPDYSRVIPTISDKVAIVPRDELIAGLDRMAVLTTKDTKCIRTAFHKGVLELHIRNADLGEACEEVPCDYDGNSFVIGFNGDYWRTVLRAMASDNVMIRMLDDAAPTLMVSAAEAKEADCEAHKLGQIHVLMPMRV
ncbi:DNA polymerase III subunit beta [Novosphingobium sp. SG707]|uniref:DNA polymerase III subunit beta n=1 Tax=Novosphingobium sp. SG707 TaxID=2586996 RepID=UPI0014451F1C|nr:DNA polymerase III subunit beta [Novosphingobium sp. SG707]NKI99607.1 DNA polymerase-3 subunit beta [Novosphingobium sp. SG707]